MNSLAESAVYMTKLHAQRILLATRLESDMWEEAVNYCWFIRNITVTARMASARGRGQAPITIISNNNVDDYECDRRRDYAWPPGTLALVHDPGKHGGANDLTHARYGRVIRIARQSQSVISCSSRPGNCPNGVGDCPNDIGERPNDTMVTPTTRLAAPATREGYPSDVGGPRPSRG